VKRLLKRNIFIYAVDVIASTAASLVALMVVRYHLSAIPNFSDYILGWGLWSFGASCVAIFFSKTHKIVFKYASFKAISNIIVCILIKDLIMVVPMIFNMSFIIEDSTTLIVADVSVTLITMIFLKVIPIYYVDNDFEEIQDIEEKAVNCLNIAIFGTSSKSIAAITRYQNSRKYRVAAILTKDKVMNGKIVMDIPVIYCPDDITNFSVKDVEAVLFPMSEDMLAESDRLVKQLSEKGICIMTLPSAESTNYPDMELTEIKHLMENNFIPDHMSGISRATKRIIDFIVANILIVVLAIPMLIIYFVLLITEGKPVLFKQERIGRFGRPFNILKFRTMRLDAEANGPALYSGDDDPRMTKVGKFLRQHHLDELPQLFNVWMGDMSFVGYRPERKVYIEQIIKKDPRYSYLYQIRPGVTSYATLRNGYTDSLEKMVKRLQYDLYYLNHRNLLLDFKVIWDTVMNIAIGKKI